MIQRRIGGKLVQKRSRVIIKIIRGNYVLTCMHGDEFK
jgi:hypothetical protein